MHKLDLLDAISSQRQRLGFLTIAETVHLNERGNTVLDPFSVLISKGAQIGSGNLFYSNVIVECGVDGKVSIGDANVFYPSTLIDAKAGSVTIGNGNQFGEGGVAIKANRDGAKIIIGDGGRYLSGATVVGQTVLGSGSQILGPITVEGCELAAGAPFTGPDPDLRGGVLKGQGLARNIKLGVGEVISGQGRFSQAIIQQQSEFHAENRPHGKD